MICNKIQNVLIPEGSENMEEKNNISVYPRIHRYVKVKSGKTAVLLKIFLNKATFDCFVNLSPIFIIFSIQDKNYIVYITSFWLR